MKYKWVWWIVAFILSAVVTFIDWVLYQLNGASDFHKFILATYQSWGFRSSQEAQIIFHFVLPTLVSTCLLYLGIWLISLLFRKK